MWKKTLLALYLASNYVWASSSTTEMGKHYTESELKQLKNDWLYIYRKEELHAQQLRISQRQNFQQTIYLIDTVVAQKQLSPQTEFLIQQLLSTLSGYPLEMEAEWAFINAKSALKQLTSIDIQRFVLKYPDTLYKQRLQQWLFDVLYQEQQFEKLVEYAKTITPSSAANKCRLFSAQYEIAANKAQINPEVMKVTATENAELVALTKAFDEFWVATPNLTSECANLEAYWLDQGLKTDEKMRLKAVESVKKNAGSEISTLALNASNNDIKTWLNTVFSVWSTPKNLQNFVENQPLDSAFYAENKSIILQLFPQYIRTLSENMEKPSFELYQQWAEKYQLTPDELKSWKFVFISRLFDNADPIFRLWRDEQIKALQSDTLTERRLRIAIGQKEDLNEWLALLSTEGKNKAEWRYWLAKSEKNQTQRQAILQKLMKERGFYSMLAAQQLNSVYQLPSLTVANLTSEQLNLYAAQFERIQEFRVLDRFEQAKAEWIALIKSEASSEGNIPTDKQLSIIKYAKEQNWHDLAVEGTIQAKAFDYLELRLPNAYSDWFDLNLKDKKISKTFAQAIARQESAWNSDAKSHANARGLMQLLPTTAQKTAKDNGLPFKGERDLFKPFNNIMLGTTHLAELNEKYPNNRILIAAAYNAGARRVEQWLQRSNKRLAMDEFIATIPFYETRGYVQNVLAYDYYYKMLYGGENLPKNDLKMFYQEELDQKY